MKSVLLSQPNQNHGAVQLSDRDDQPHNGRLALAIVAEEKEKYTALPAQ